MKFFLQTFGCQQNLSDSERITQILESNSFKEAKTMEEADLIIFNTCSVRKHAEDRFFGFLRNANKLRKQKSRIITVTGCVIRKTSTINSEKKDKIFNQTNFLDLAFRIEDAIRLPELLENLNNKNICSSAIGENLESFFSIKPKLKNTFSAFVPIMTGCNKFCTYCIVPYARGEEKSRKIKDIITECKDLSQKGVKEIFLLGQNVNAYYTDDNKRKISKNQTDFAYLLNEIAKIKSIKRIRFTSPHPSQMSKDVIDAMAENENICSHLHLPVQSGSDEILQKMNRSHTRKDFQEIIKYARKKIPNIAISTDIIVGFPFETEENFLETKSLCEEEEFDMIYISKFSPRKGTVAAKFEDNISLSEKKKRFEILQEILKKTALKQNKKWVGKKVKILIEEIKNSVASGKTEQFKVVHSNGKSLKVGDFAEVKITEAKTWFLIGEM